MYQNEDIIDIFIPSIILILGATIGAYYWSIWSYMIAIIMIIFMAFMRMCIYLFLDYAIEK